MNIRDLFSTANAEALGFVVMFYGGIALVVAAVLVVGYVLYRLLF